MVILGSNLEFGAEGIQWYFGVGGCCLGFNPIFIFNFNFQLRYSIHMHTNKSLRSKLKSFSLFLD